LILVFFFVIFAIVVYLVVVIFVVVFVVANVVEIRREKWKQMFGPLGNVRIADKDQGKGAA
jgi:hypothetical protein